MNNANRLQKWKERKINVAADPGFVKREGQSHRSVADPGFATIGVQSVHMADHCGEKQKAQFSAPPPPPAWICHWNVYVYYS